jgi:hypothetical protein
MGFTESVVEDAALAWFEALVYAVKHGPTSLPENRPRSAATRATARS